MDVRMRSSLWVRSPIRSRMRVGRSTTHSQRNAVGQSPIILTLTIYGAAHFFASTGKLTEDTNTYKGVVIKYNEPEDARKPTEKWRLYAFKGNQTLPILHIHRQSGFLIGRDRKIADIPMDHPSISKQHAVLQYRFVRLVRLYLIDLDSVNGTYLNNEKIEPRRYYELIEKDVIKFGFSTREYVVMTANLDEDDDDSDN
ncbi:unnamed protein product [Echinostoma caproni]|uniref:FHA domain-containing protein n=1 Tax=Echinostoma caproni TaxID=27848 RepID=A0A183AIL2_9TREM|nr:unnamed protein product [Echinostoma caproni]